MFIKSLVFIQLLISVSAFAGTRLPFHSLRDQDSTMHCWAYAMSHAVESRALSRDHMTPIVYVEKEVKRWVDYERLMYMYKTKNDFYFDPDSEGAWPIEYWEALLKHGFQIYKVSNDEPTLTYPINKPYYENLGFIDYERPPVDPDLIDVDEMKRKLRNEISNDAEATKFIEKYLKGLFGDPTMTTKWFEKTVNINEISALLLGKDVPAAGSLQDKINKMALVVPVSDGNQRWVKYLENRYWGYRYDSKNIFLMIETSLKNGYPIPFDNTQHAMTIIGFEKVDTTTYYAVADSSPAKITWKPGSTLKDQLHHLYFYTESIPGVLPPKPEQQPISDRDYDELDGFITPPGCY